MAGRIKNEKTFSLEDMFDGWTEACFVTMNVFRFRDLAKFRDLGVKDSDDVTEENLDEILYVIKGKFKAGKIMALSDPEDQESEQVLADMERDDLDYFPAGVVGEIVEWAMGKTSPKSKKS